MQNQDPSEFIAKILFGVEASCDMTRCARGGLHGHLKAKKIESEKGLRTIAKFKGCMWTFQKLDGMIGLLHLQVDSLIKSSLQWKADDIFLI